MRTLLAFALLTLALQAGAAGPDQLSRYSGRMVYVDFWASWCGPCAQSFPWLNAMQAKYGPRLTVVGVNVDTEPAAADAFLKKHPASFDIVRDPKGALPEHYAIEGMPSSLILDGSGHVVHRHSGFRQQDTAEYERAIEQALAGSPQARP